MSERNCICIDRDYVAWNVVLRLFVFVLALVLNGCFERPKVEGIRGSWGQGATRVSAATLDSRGNIIVVGSTLATGLGSEKAFQRSSSSAWSVKYIEPDTGVLRDFARAPEEYLDGLSVVGGTPHQLFLGKLGSSFRREGDGWVALAVSDRFPDELIPYGNTVSGAGQTLYMSVRDFNPDVRDRMAISRDNGKSWRISRPGAPAGSVVVDSANPCRAMTGDGKNRTVDCGLSWQSAPFFPDGRVLMFDFRKGGRWIATARGFLYESRDVGLSWTAVTATGPEPFHSLIPDQADADEAFAAGAQGLYHSEEKGRNWRVVSRWSLVGGSEQIYPQLYATPGTRAMYITFSAESGPTQGNNVAVSLDSGVSFRVVQTEAGRIQVATSPEGGLYTSRPPEPDAFVAKFDGSGRPVFFTYLGGEGFDEATSVSVDSNDDIVVGGRTKSASFPGDWSYGEDRGGFVVKLRGDGTRLQWASRFPAPENAVYFTTAAGAGDTFYVYGFASAARGPYFLHMASDGRTVLRDVRPAPFGGRMRLEANGDLLLCGNPVTRYRAATGKTETLTESYRDLTFTSARVGADGNLWVFGGVTRGFDGQGASGVTSGVFQRLIAGTIDLLPGDSREGYIGKFSPDGKLLAGTLYGGERMETVLDGFADAGGNVLAIGTTTSAKLPMRSPLDMQLMPGRETGFALKMNSTLSELTMATYLTEFQPAAILPHPEGGYWLVGSGREDAGSRAFQDIYLKRIRSSPAELPRIDSVSADPAKFIALRPGGTAFLTGEGFTNETVVEFGSHPVAPRAVEGTRMQALVPGNLPGGIYDVTVVTKGRRSAPVRVRLFSLE